MMVDIFKNSLFIDEYKFVFCEYEENFFKYFGYGYYWIGLGVWGEFVYFDELVELQYVEELDMVYFKKFMNYLCVVVEVGGYEVVIIIDNVGYISNFIIDM